MKKKNLGRMIIPLVVSGAFMILQPAAISAQEGGVYVSRPLTEKEVDNVLNEFVRRVVISSVLESTGMLIERIVRGQNIPLYPPMAGLAVQQVALRVFQHEELMETCRDAYDQSLEMLKIQREDGVDQETIKHNVKQNTEKLLKPVYEHALYRRIIEKILEHSLKEQQRLIVMSTAQKQAQMMLVQQQLNNIRKQAFEAYLSNISIGSH